VARMEASGVSRWSGKQEVAGACAGVRRSRACAYWREEEGDRGKVETGWAVLGQFKWAPGKLGRWPGGLLSLSLLVSVFYFFSVSVLI